MALQDAKREMENAAKLLTQLFRDELIRQKLVNTGSLLNSIEWIVISTTTGFKLQMKSLDYFEFLDNRYNITNNVLKSSQYNRVTELIANSYTFIITDQLDQIK
jgi:hypothetical protein